MRASIKQVILKSIKPPFGSFIWLDISDLSTLFQDTAGTIPVTAVGDPVGLVLDKSGFNNHASQSTDSKRPTLQIDEYGRYYIQFDGTDDILSTENVDLSTTDSVYIYLGIAKETSTASTKVIIELGVGAPTTNMFYVADSTIGIRLFSSGSVAPTVVALPNVLAPFSRELSFNFSIPGSHRIGIENGTVLRNDTQSQGSGFYKNDKIYIGSRLNSLYSDIKLFQLIIRKKESSLYEIRTMERYFSAKKQQIQYRTIAPDNVNLLVSDYTAISEQSSARLRFIRSITEANNYKYCSPGSRVGLSTNAKSVRFSVYYNDLVTREDSRNYVGLLMVDDTVVQTFTNPNSASTATVVVTKTYSTNATRKFELIWPYGDGMDLMSVDVSVDATVIEAPAARPAIKLNFLGDSITHGFYASDISASWTYKIANTKNYQLINSGYGSLTAVASYGLTVVACDAVVVTIGVNNYLDQQALATFKAAYKSMIENIRTTLPSAKIYAVTPFYISATPLSIPLSDYRTQESDAVTEIADGNTVLIDGLTLMTNNSNRLADGIHPNDTGCSEIATNLSALIV